MEKNTSVKSYMPDMLQIGIEYSLTINPDNAHQYLLKKDDRMEMVHNYLFNYHLYKLKDHCNFALYPEFSNPNADTKGSVTRMHYHGKIKFNNIEGIFMWYNSIYNGLKKISFIEIDTIDNHQTWKNYYSKNKVVMSLLCKHAGISYGMKHTDVKNERLNAFLNETNNMNKENARVSRTY